MVNIKKHKTSTKILTLLIIFFLLRPYSADAGCPTVPCKSSFSKNGEHVSHQQYEFDLGTDKGEVQVEFEAYYVPDKFVITPSGKSNVLKDSGFVSGSKKYKFSWDFERWGTTKVTVHIYTEVVGTAWMITLSCPNGSISNNDRNLDLVDIFFGFGIDTNLTDGTDVPRQRCTFDFIVDRSIKIHSNGSGQVKSLQLVKGNHSYQYMSSTCSSQSGTIPYNVYFSVNNGLWNRLNNPPSGSTPSDSQEYTFTAN